MDKSASRIGKTLALILLMVALPAAASKTPKAPKPPKDVGSLSAMARHYIKVDKKMAASAAPRTVELLAHWQELHALRIGLSRLDHRGDLKKLKEGRRIVLRHALAQLLGDQPDVAVDNDPKVEKAHSQRTEDLFAIGQLARRAFDIVTADANATWLDG
jgi:hypothetical protein